MRHPLQPLTLLLAILALALAGWHLATQAAPTAAGKTAHAGTSAPVHTAPVKPHAKTKSRGASDTFHVDNRSNYEIDIYANGQYKGTVPGMGDLYFYDRAGNEMTVLGKAPNANIQWGSQTCTVPYTWTLSN